MRDFFRFPFLRSAFLSHNKKNHIILGVWRFKCIQATARHTVLLQSSQDSFAPSFFFPKGKKGGEPQTIHMTTTHKLPFSLISSSLSNTLTTRFSLWLEVYPRALFSQMYLLSSAEIWVFQMTSGSLGGKTRQACFCIFLWVFFLLLLGVTGPKREKKLTLTGFSHK